MDFDGEDGGKDEGGVALTVCFLVERASSFRVSHILHLQINHSSMKDEFSYFKDRLFEAVRMMWGLVGFILMLPIFWSDNPYQRAWLGPSRRSRRVAPPEVSDIHISCPEGISSSEVIKTSEEEYI